MEVLGSEFEILRVSETVSHSVEGFDVVVDSLHDHTGDEVFEVVEQARPITGEDLGNIDEMFDSGFEQILTPVFEECLSRIQILFIPVEPSPTRLWLMAWFCPDGLNSGPCALFTSHPSQSSESLLSQGA